MDGFGRGLLLAVTEQIVWGTLWLGLATLTIALLVLMRTRWGQSQPLGKCAALSALAHLLLAGYATTVQIVSAASAPAETSAAVQVTFVDPFESSVTDPDEPRPDQPWQRLPSEATLAFEPPELARTATPSPNSEPARTEATVSAPVASETIIPPATAVPPLDLSDDQAAPTHVAPPQEAEQAEAATAEPVPPSSIEPDVPRPDRSTAAPLEPTTSASQPPASSRPPEIEAPSPLPANPAEQVHRVDNWLDGPNTAAAGPSSPAPAQDLSPDGGAGDADGGNQNNSPQSEAIIGAVPASMGNGASASGEPPLVAVPRLDTGAKLPEIYQFRGRADKAEIAKQRGGSDQAEAAVQAALRWLAENQSGDGHWDASDHGAGREEVVLGHDRNGAGAGADTGVTGLALLAMLGAGNTHLSGKYALNVQRGLEYLLNVQARDGNLAGSAETYAFMYCHGIATLSLSEAYAMTRDGRLEKPLRSAIAYSLRAQHLPTGSWRYRPVEPGDTSQLGWQLMALKSAELAGIEIPAANREAMVRFLKSVSSGTSGGLASYRPLEGPSRTMTAEALVCRQFLGMTRDNPASDEAGEYVLKEMPSPTGRPNLYYWYYGTLAMYQLQGDHWEQWNAALQPSLLRRQVTTGKLAGSWDPDCIWGGHGGRIYSTAMAALCLEVYYRFLPLYELTGTTGANAK